MWVTPLLGRDRGSCQYDDLLFYHSPFTHKIDLYALTQTIM